MTPEIRTLLTQIADTCQRWMDEIDQILVQGQVQGQPIDNAIYGLRAQLSHARQKAASLAVALAAKVRA